MVPVEEKVTAHLARGGILSLFPEGAMNTALNPSSLNTFRYGVFVCVCVCVFFFFFSEVSTRAGSCWCAVWMVICVNCGHTNHALPPLAPPPPLRRHVFVLLQLFSLCSFSCSFFFHYLQPQ